MKTYLKKLYRYNQWANEGLCKHLQQQKDELPEVMKLFSHLVAAEETWYHRIQPLDFELLPLFSTQNWSVLKPRMISIAQRWVDLADAREDFQENISYQNTSGDNYQTPLGDIMIHLANHSTYHRGQIAIIMREAGQKAAVTDYIAFCRL